jgi:hypothetical protein
MFRCFDFVGTHHRHGGDQGAGLAANITNCDGLHRHCHQASQHQTSSTTTTTTTTTIVYV